MYAIKSRTGPVSLVLERSSNTLQSRGIAFSRLIYPPNIGKVGVATWQLPKNPGDVDSEGESRLGTATFAEAHPARGRQDAQEEYENIQRGAEEVGSPPDQSHGEAFFSSQSDGSEDSPSYSNVIQNQGMMISNLDGEDLSSPNFEDSRTELMDSAGEWILFTSYKGAGSKVGSEGSSTVKSSNFDDGVIYSDRPGNIKGEVVRDPVPFECVEDEEVRAKYWWETISRSEESEDVIDGQEVVWTREGELMGDEYLAALQRGSEDLTYDPSVGLSCTKILPGLFIGSSLKTSMDISFIRKLGVTAILNLQRGSEQVNWGTDWAAIAAIAHENGLRVVHQPIRDFDGYDLRLKLPVAVGFLLRLLRKGHCVYVSSSAGLGRAPACAIALLQWTGNLSLAESFNYVTSLHPSAPNRGAVMAATWDLVAMVQQEQLDRSPQPSIRPPTHSVQFVWNHGGREVLVVGEFLGGWKVPIPALHVGGPKFAVDLRLPQGKYCYKFIVDGQWRHAVDLPTERDEWGNTNNVVHVGAAASRLTGRLETTKERVIERPLTADERKMLTYAIYRLAFQICPLTYAAKV
eukprot:TRINITY_DN15224_c0_g2_i8.p1 TRINITY_DN15224_c0_g2~~TRINITY_DN15224_c0_g2_i8.p1  ORF type:complete len:576 (-),score=126.35 TRINITY_DN15224_c0_g2_i8:717-2444(-)